MNRRDFLAQLESALENELSVQEVRENIDYYNGYIQEEIQNGKSEQEVMDLLGDPWAIAKTILMSSGKNEQSYRSESESVPERRDDYRGNANVHVFGLDTWWKKAAVIAVIVGVIALVISIVFGIISLVAPIALPVLVIIFVLRMFKKDK